MRKRGFIAGIVAWISVLSLWGVAADKQAPQITFLEPTQPQIAEKAESVPIAFRVVSPDGARLTQYEVLIDGVRAHPQPFPIEPSLSEADIRVTWERVHRYPDGVYRITVRVMDSKGRRGEATLVLIKGRVASGPSAQILSPAPGQVLRGKVPVLVRAEDQHEGIASLTVRAVERQSSQVYPLLMRIFGVPEKVVEVKILWETDAVDPASKKSLFPDGVYLLQARAISPSKREGLAGEVLVYVANGVAQPPITPGPVSGVPPRGGLIPGEKEGAVSPAPPAASPSTSPQEPPSLILPEPAPKVVTPSPVGTGSITPEKPKPLKPSVSAKPITGTPEASVKTIAPQLTEEVPSLQPPAPISPPASQPRMIATLTESPSKKASLLPIVQETVPVMQPPRPITQQRPRPILEPLREGISPKEDLPIPETVTRLPATELPVRPVVPPRRRAADRLSRRPAPPLVIRPDHSFSYTAIAGDTLFGLSERFGVSVAALAQANGLAADQELVVGQKLVIPTRPVKVIVDGKAVEGDVPAFLRDGRAVGPFRGFAVAAGMTVGWDHKSKEAWATRKGLELRVGIGKRTVLVGDSLQTLSFAPFLLRNRTFVPIRDVGEALGKWVLWSRGTVILGSPLPSP
ncbi:MAG: stalk domain-containing protein [Armatimonadetes bacterium]|nr:stalk domain-containing protein [Armatimonadota bacterium]MDW8121898.1 stalk domain-containing protein [Armatimonadota bacterium]